MTDEFFLTIALPTYNNEAFRDTLASIPDYAGSANIEVLVVDDSDDDFASNNEATAKSFSKFPLRILRGKKMSLDHADFTLMKAARGKYVWWFGDDFFLPDSLDYLTHILQKEPDFVFCNSLSDQGRSLDLRRSGWVSPAEMIVQARDSLTFLSALVWRRAEYLRYIHEGEPYLGSLTAYLYPMIAHFAEGGRYWIEATPLFKTQKRNFRAQKYCPFEVFVVNYEAALTSRPLPEGLEEAVKIELRRQRFQILRGMIVWRFRCGVGWLATVPLAKVTRYFGSKPEFYPLLAVLLMISGIRLFTEFPHREKV